MAKIEENIDWKKFENVQICVMPFLVAFADISALYHTNGIEIYNAVWRAQFLNYKIKPKKRIIGYVANGFVHILGDETPLCGEYSITFENKGSQLAGSKMEYSPQANIESNICAARQSDSKGGYVPLTGFAGADISELTAYGNYRSLPIIFQKPGYRFPTNWNNARLTRDPKTTAFVLPYNGKKQFPSATLSLPYESAYHVTTRFVDSTNILSESKLQYSDAIDISKEVPTTPPSGYYWESITEVSSLKSSFSEYGDNMLFFDLILSKDLQACLKYLDDGTVPADADVNDRTAKTDSDTSNESGEDGNKESKFDENEPSVPAVNSVKLSNLHNYWITQNQMQSFYSSVWETDLTDFVKGAFTGIYSNLISNVISLKYMPTKAENLGGTGDTSPVILGFKTYDDLTVQTIGNTTAPIVNIGSYKFAKEYNSFADYAPYTDVKLYLPFVGVVPIDTNLFMGSGGGETATLNVKAQYDLQSGLITYFIMRNKTMISSVSGRMAVEVPVSLQSGLDTFSTISSNFVGKATSFAGNIATGNPIGMVADIAQGSATAPPQTVFASTGGDGAFYAHPKCMIMIRHPQYNRPKNYSHVVGFPAYVTKKVSDLQGFNIIQNPAIPLADGMTGAEHDMIVTAMQNGLYY